MSHEDAERLFREIFGSGGRGGFPGGGFGGFGGGGFGGGGGGFQQVQQEIYQGPDGRIKVRTTRTGADGKRTVEERDMEDGAGAGPFGHPFGGFAAGGQQPRGRGWGGGGDPRRGRDWGGSAEQRAAAAEQQRLAQEMMKKMAKEAAKGLAQAAARAAADAAKRSATRVVENIIRALTGKGGPPKK